MNTSIEDTIIALATPQGIGAIAVIRLSGPKALDVSNSFFPSKDLSKQNSHTIHYGTLRDENGNILDEVLFSIFLGPNSYTGEDVLEISCHGSPFIRQQIIELFIRNGVRPATAGEFTMRAFLNGKLDLSQAEAVADLIASDSASSHELAIQQMRGGFSQEISALRQKLVDFASLIELELDFSEEDVEFADRSKLIELVDKILRLIRALTDSFKLGNVIKNGVSTVIAGRPNAGKSTLLNALLKEERAIVSEIAGTTRDTIEEVLNINGIQFRLIDTAGIREAGDQIEAIGVEKTMEKIQQSALLIYVFDAAKLREEEVHDDLSKLVREGLHVLAVANKMDLNPTLKPEWYHKEGLLAPDQLITVSAINNMNLEYLKECLHQSVLEERVQVSGSVVSNARHYAALTGAGDSLNSVLTGLRSGVPGDLIAMDIRHSLHHLGLITGEVTTDDLLGNIFGKFCIGK